MRKISKLYKIELMNWKNYKIVKLEVPILWKTKKMFFAWEFQETCVKNGFFKGLMERIMHNCHCLENMNQEKITEETLNHQDLPNMIITIEITDQLSNINHNIPLLRDTNLKIKINLQEQNTILNMNKSLIMKRLNKSINKSNLSKRKVIDLLLF